VSRPDGKVRSLRYLEPNGSLKPADAAVAIIIDDSGRYFVQLRDSKPTIFFPDHWGCFGGAIEPGETDRECLSRELQEEIGLDINSLSVSHFTTFSFDFGFAGGSVIRRIFYEVSATAASLSNLTLREGRAMQLFPGPRLLAMQVVPYDRFALWMHCYRAELGILENASAIIDEGS
jgi:8-oxo-dGTP diphosphatase